MKYFCTVILLMVVAQANATLATRPNYIAPEIAVIPDYVQQRINFVKVGPGSPAIGTPQPIDVSGSMCRPNSVTENSTYLFVACEDKNGENMLQVIAYKLADVHARTQIPLRPGKPSNMSPLTPDEVISISMKDDAIDNRLIGMATDPQGNVFVSEYMFNDNNHLLGYTHKIDGIKKGGSFTLHSQYITKTPAAPAGLAFDSDGTLWIASQYASGVVVGLKASTLANPVPDTTPDYCISNGGANGACLDSGSALNGTAEGISIFDGKVWVGLNGGNSPGIHLVGFDKTKATTQAKGTSISATIFGAGVDQPLACPGGLFATISALWVNDEGYRDTQVSPTQCGASNVDTSAHVGQLLKLNKPNLEQNVTDHTKLTAYQGVVDRPGFGGIFIESH